MTSHYPVTGLTVMDDVGEGGVGFEVVSPVSEVGVVRVEGSDEISPVLEVTVRGVIGLETVSSVSVEGTDVVSLVGVSVQVERGALVDVVGIALLPGNQVKTQSDSSANEQM